MKPIKLKLKGINSFVNEVIVDFERLTETGIFGIVGDTGSGKSTIIDAMILALYGEVPRYNKKTDRDFVNSYVDEAFVSFTFQVIVNGKGETYKIERGFKKKDNKIDEKISRFIKINEDNEEIITSKILEIRNNIIELLGLKYEDFTRAVILPQGKFSEFLTLENVERRSMLERIFKLEKYGDKLSKKIKENYNIVENQLKILDANLEANINVTDEAIKELKTKKIFIDTQLEQIHKNEIKLTKELETKKELLSIVEELEKELKTKNILISKKEEMEKKTVVLNNSVKAESLIDYINKIEDTEKELLLINKDKILLEKKYDENKVLEEKVVVEYEKILNYKVENYEKLLNKISDVKKAVEEEEQLKDKKKELVKIREEYKAEKNKLKEDEKQIEELQLKSNQLTKSIDNTKIEKDKNKITQEYRNVILKGVETEKELKSTIQEKLNIEKELEEDKKIIILNEEELNKKIELEKDLTRKYEKFNVDAKVLNKVKESLKIGEICPVCGEKIKNQLIVNKESEEKIDEKQLQQIREEISKINVIIGTSKNRIEKNKELFYRITEKETKLTEVLTKLKKNENIETFLVEYKLLEEKEGLYEKLEKEIAELDNELKKINIKYEDLKTNLTVKEKNLDNKENQGKTIKAMVEEASIRLEKLVGKDNPTQLWEQLEKKKNDLLTKESNAKASLEKIKDIVQDIKSKLEGTYKEITTLTKINNDNKNIIEEKIKSMNFQDTNEVKVAYIGKELQITLEEEIKQYNNNLLITTNKVQNLESKVKDVNVKKLKEEYTLAIDTYEKLTEEKNNSNKELGSIKTELERLESKIKEVKKWLGEKRLLTKDMDNLNILRQLFKGNSFIEFIGKRHLKYICAEGTRRLKAMSSDKYEIQLKESDFVIKDNSRGGIIRSPKTLSGGEVFMVSLCLSLALSNQIQMKNSGSLDMFFLDEGFGTLDNNSRDIVINSLVNLIDDNKMKIGLITHVEEIKEMLPSKLVVTIDHTEEGSKAIIKR